MRGGKSRAAPDVNCVMPCATSNVHDVENIEYGHNCIEQYYIINIAILYIVQVSYDAR